MKWGKMKNKNLYLIQILLKFNRTDENALLSLKGTKAWITADYVIQRNFGLYYFSAAELHLNVRQLVQTETVARDFQQSPELPATLS